MCANTMSYARPSLSEQILAAAQDGIICLDLEGRIKFANPAAAHLLGCAAADELLDQPVRTYIQFAGPSSVPDEPAEATGLVVAGMTLLPRGDATDVSWAMYGPSPFMAKLMHVFMNMDNMVGKDFAAGLANLKRVAET